jgi:MFS family permease
MAELRTPWRAVAAMFFLSGGLFGAWAGRIPAFVDRFALSEDRLGLLLLCIAIGAVVCFPFAGHLADRRGAARVTLSLAGFATAMLALLPFAPTVPVFAVALVLFGAAQGGLDVAMNSWAAEVERHMARPVMSSFHAMFSLGGGLGAGSGFLAAHAGLEPGGHFVATALALGLPCLWLAAIPWTSVRTSGGPIFALPRGALALVGLIALFSALGEGVMADWSAVYLHSVKGLSEARATLGFAMFSVTMVLARLMADRVVGHYGAVPSARLGSLVAAGGMAVLLTAGSLPVMLAGFAAIGLGYAVLFPLAYSRAANDPHVPPGRAIASVATLGYGGLLAGPPMIGFLSAVTSLGHAFALVAALTLLVSVLAGSLRPAVVRT